MESVKVYFQHLGPGKRGQTDGVDVWISKRLLQVERRCVAAHEGEHLRRGHDGCVSGTEEARVRFAAAKWLVPDPHDVADALIGAGLEYTAAADHLWIDEVTLLARLDRRFMHPAERALIDEKVRAELHA